jgi:hypothetical protein
MARGMQNLIDHGAMVAKVKRGYFEALVKEGFTEEQSLELCLHSIQI